MAQRNARHTGDVLAIIVQQLLLRSNGEIITAGFLGSSVEVASGGRQRRVAQRLAHRGQIGAAAQGVGPVRVAQEVRRDQRFEPGRARRTPYPIPRVPSRHREDPIVAQGVGGPQGLQLGPGPAREPYHPRAAALAAHVDDPVDEVAPFELTASLTRSPPL